MKLDDPHDVQDARHDLNDFFDCYDMEIDEDDNHPKMQPKFNYGKINALLFFSMKSE